MATKIRPADYDLAEPHPSALIESLRAVGYNVPAALADIIDNSLTADAKNIWLDFHWAGGKSRISVLDDGSGMSESGLIEAMRPGTTNPLQERNSKDLGRFGLGLKTASFSQCRHLSVWSKQKNKPVSGRCWDLSYVAKHNQWRLRKDLPVPSTKCFEQLQSLRSGTLVIWNDPDRIVGEAVLSTDKEAHSGFFSLIQEVKDHLSMVFHRYISGDAASKTRRVNIYVNGPGDDARLRPWNPFEGGAGNPAVPTPVEEISHRGRQVVVRGYILPHKDRITTEEFNRLAGPKGWLAQQGYYIYRNDRILVAGDWLRLGNGQIFRKEEHYKLARLSIDIPNSLDLDWGLDVKKSIARPPAALRVRLTELADKVRKDARQIFAHRGQYGPRPVNDTLTVAHPWQALQRGDRQVYRINREHPLIADFLQKLGPLAAAVAPILRLIEETVPVERIWLDKADAQLEHAVPYEGIDEVTIVADIQETYRYLRKHNQSVDLCRKLLLATSPYNRYPDLVNRVINQPV
jgi:hypothetical protein